MLDFEVPQQSWQHPLTSALEIVFGILAREQAEAGIDKLRSARADDDEDPVWRQDAAYLPGGSVQVGHEFQAAYAHHSIELTGGKRHILGHGAIQARLHPVFGESTSDLVLTFVDIQGVQLARVQGEFR